MMCRRRTFSFSTSKRSPPQESLQVVAVETSALMQQSLAVRWPSSFPKLSVCIGRHRWPAAEGGRRYTLRTTATESQSSSFPVRPHYTRRLGKETFMKLIRLVFAVMCISVPFSVFAEQGVLHEKVAPDTYGTSSLTYVSLTPWDFRPQDSNSYYIFIAMPPRFWRSGSGSLFEAPLRLPEGAIVSYLEMYSCTDGGMGNIITSTLRGEKTDNTWSSSGGP